MNGWGPKNSVCPSNLRKPNFLAGYPGIFARTSGRPKSLRRKSSCCDPSDHSQESPGPLGPKSQKSLNKSLYGVSKKSPENTRKGDFWGIFRLLRTFLETQKRLFLRLFWDFGPRPLARRPPVNGRSGRIVLLQILSVV